jgi:hypothetical protein
MNNEQIYETIVHRLGDQADLFVQRLLPQPKQTPQHHSSLYTLASHPVILNALIDIALADGDLPKNDTRLLQRLTSLLWRENTPDSAAIDVAASAFGRLAFAMIDEDKVEGVPVKYALKHLKNPHLLSSGQNACFIEVHDDRVKFSHALFQHYFAAIHLNGRRQLKQYFTIPAFEFQPLRSSIIGVKQKTGKWDSVILAAAGLLNPADTLVTGLLDINPFLAAEVIASEIHISPALRTQTRKILQQLLHSENEKQVKVQHRHERKHLGAFILSLPVSLTVGLVNTVIDTIEEMFESYSASMGSPFLAAGSDVGPWQGNILGDKKFVELEQAMRYAPVREAAAICLGELGDAAAIPDLLELLRDENMWVRRAAATAIAQMGNAGKDALLETLKQTKDDAREALVRALGWTGNPALIPMLLGLGQDPERRVSNAALDALKILGALAIPELMTALSSANGNHRWLASMLLKEMGENAVQPLASLLQPDNSIEISANAARLLEDMEIPSASKTAADWWIICLPNTTKYPPMPSKRVCDLAVESLQRIGTPEALAAVEAWRHSQQGGES